MNAGIADPEVRKKNLVEKHRMWKREITSESASRSMMTRHGKEDRSDALFFIFPFSTKSIEPERSDHV